MRPRWGIVFLAATSFACSSSSPPASSDAGAQDSGAANRRDAGADAGSTLDPTYFDSCAADDGPDPVFTWQNPDPSTIDTAALQSLLADAETAQSDAVMIAVGDTIVAHKCWAASTDPQTVQSVTKSVVSLAIGILIHDGKIASADVPVSTFFTEWTDDRAPVTIRMLLTQTSGYIDAIDDAGMDALFDASDETAYARAQHPTVSPGTEFDYSNINATLLGGIIALASGKDAGDFIVERILTPIGITDGSFYKDASGHAITSGGLFLTPIDLLRVARLAREGGAWQGSQIVPTDWITQTTTTAETIAPYDCYATMWWLVRDNCNADTGLEGTAGPIVGFDADGYGGNYAVVSSGSKVIGVRMKAQQSSDPNVILAQDFDAFVHRVPALAK